MSMTIFMDWRAVLQLPQISEQGIRLLEIARNAQEFYRKQGQAERAALLGFILSGSILQGDKVVSAFKSPFDIIHRIAQEARACANGDHSHADIKKQASEFASNACPILLPRTNRRQTRAGPSPP